jgi:hypothetical protein
MVVPDAIIIFSVNFDARTFLMIQQKAGEHEAGLLS